MLDKINSSTVFIKNSQTFIFWNFPETVCRTFKLLKQTTVSWEIHFIWPRNVFLIQSYFIWPLPSYSSQYKSWIIFHPKQHVLVVLVPVFRDKVEIYPTLHGILKNVVYTQNIAVSLVVVRDPLQNF